MMDSGTFSTTPESEAGQGDSRKRKVVEVPNVDNGDFHAVEAPQGDGDGEGKKKKRRKGELEEVAAHAPPESDDFFE